MATSRLANALKMLQQILTAQEETSNMHLGNQKILYSAPVLAQQSHLQRMSPLALGAGLLLCLVTFQVLGNSISCTSGWDCRGSRNKKRGHLSVVLLSQSADTRGKQDYRSKKYTRGVSIWLILFICLYQLSFSFAPKISSIILSSLLAPHPTNPTITPKLHEVI